MKPNPYCTECGTAYLAQHNKTLTKCLSCGYETRHYPTVVVTCFVNLNASFLWVRRAIEPKLGKWAIPGGYLEAGESLRAGAARELHEETGIVLSEDQLQFYTLGSLTFINQIYVGFRATVESDTSHTTNESSECRFFTAENCPWSELAYPEVNVSIEQAYEELANDSFSTWYVELTEKGYSRKPSNLRL